MYYKFDQDQLAFKKVTTQRIIIFYTNICNHYTNPFNHYCYSIIQEYNSYRGS